MTPPAHRRPPALPAKNSFERVTLSAPCEVSRDAAHGLLEHRADFARRHVRKRVKDHLRAFLPVDPVEKDDVQVGIESQIVAATTGDGIVVGGLTAHVLPMTRSESTELSFTISPSSPRTSAKESAEHW